MRIWVARYQLRPLKSLNRLVATGASASANTSFRQGALLRIDESGASGYADLHPWPELGDLRLEDQLDLLARGCPTSQATRSLTLARLDREARAQGRSAFDDLRIPGNHFLVSDPLSFTRDDLEKVIEAGFPAIKLKVGRDPDREVKKLTALFAQDHHVFQLRPGPPLRLRLDFNGALSTAGFERFLTSLPPTLIEAIEFIEDPCALPLDSWRGPMTRTHRVPLALDRITSDEWDQLESTVFADGFASGSPFDWIVLKPAVQEPGRLVRLAERTQARVVVTSYLDHPVGQMGAALEAARLTSSTAAVTADRIGICGLLSHSAFERNEFSEAIVDRGPELMAPEGTGIGFDHQLERQPWRPL